MLKDIGFGVKLMEEMKAIAPEGTTFEITNMPAMNGVKTGILVKGLSGGYKAFINLDKAENSYNDGMATIEELAKVLIKSIPVMKKNSQYCPVNVLVWNDVKPYITPFLVNTGKNKEYIKEHLSKDFLDMSILYHMVLDVGKKKVRSVVSKKVIEKWGISLEELHEAAMENMRNGILTKRLSDIVIDAPDSSAWEVFTNKSQFFGAGALLVTEKLKEFADRAESDLFIFPSSIHEVIMVPTNSIARGAETCKRIVEDVNRSGAIEDEEYLSDTVYFFNRETGEITIAA